MASRVLETLGFEGEYQPDKLGPACLGHRAPEPTLCPLGQPEKAIDHESLIEPWLALYNRPACQFQTPNGVVTAVG
jgi:hypothetical protein